MPNSRSRSDASDRPHFRWPHLIFAAVVIAAWPGDPLRAQVPPLPAPPRDPSPAQPPQAPLASQPVMVAEPLEVQPLQVAPRFSEESEIPASLPHMPLAPPRPAQGPKSIDSLIDSLHGNDGTFDVIVNQARHPQPQAGHHHWADPGADCRRRSHDPRFYRGQLQATQDHWPGNRRDRPGDHDSAK